MSIQYAAKHLQQGFDVKWTVKHREGTVTQRVGEAAHAFALRGLAWSNHDGRRCGIESPQQLQDPESALGVGLRPLFSRILSGLHRYLQIDHRDVHRSGANQLGGLFPGISLHGLNAERVQQLRQLLHGRSFPPAAVGQQEVQSGYLVG